MAFRTLRSRVGTKLTLELSLSARAQRMQIGMDEHDDRTSIDGVKENTSQYRDEVFSLRVPAGKRTYFFDVKPTRSGEDFFLTITESKRISSDGYEKHKLFLYKEDFGKFVTAMHEAVNHIRSERLPEYDFRGLPELSTNGEL